MSQESKRDTKIAQWKISKSKCPVQQLRADIDILYEFLVLFLSIKPESIERLTKISGFRRVMDFHSNTDLRGAVCTHKSTAMECNKISEKPYKENLIYIIFV